MPGPTTRLKRRFAPILVILLFGALLVRLPIAIADRASDYDWFDPILEVRAILTRNFVDESKLDPDKMREATIDGMIEVLGDPYTDFVPPAELNEFNKELRGDYVGIGAEVNIIDDYLTIVSPMDGSPALEAGIMAGDIVLEVDGVSTFQRDINESINRLLGEPGTPVTIKVRHLDGAEQEYTIKRGRIIARTVKGLRRNGGIWNYCIDDELDLSYIRLTQFNEDTLTELEAVFAELSRGGLNGLVLDVRDNPGGGLPTAIKIADLFLTSGTIVSVRPRHGQQSTSAQPEGTLPQFPMIVLVNGFSASASEILAGALQENDRAKILGTRTFGKGSVQEVRELNYDRGTLKYTTAHYYLPSGRNINRSDDSTVWGVDPDPGMVVPVTDEEYIANVRARREHEAIRMAGGTGPACADSFWIRTNLKDEQLAQAVEALQQRVRGEDWPTLGEEDSTHVAFDLELKRAIDARARLMEQTREVEKRIDELSDLAVTAGKPPLLPPDVDLLEGVITVRDKHGNVIGAYQLEGGNLELALQGLQLTPVAEPDAGD